MLFLLLLSLYPAAISFIGVFYFVSVKGLKCVQCSSLIDPACASGDVTARDCLIEGQVACATYVATTSIGEVGT